MQYLAHTANRKNATPSWWPNSWADPLDFSENGHTCRAVLLEGCSPLLLCCCNREGRNPRTMNPHSVVRFWDRPGRRAKGSLQRVATARTADRKRTVHNLAMI